MAVTNKTYTMVACIVNAKEDVVGYGMISDNYQSLVMNVDQFTKFLRDGNKVNNIALQNGKIEFTNGVKSRYTMFNDVDLSVKGQSHAVILDRVEDDKGQLMGYTIYDADGVVRYVKCSDAVVIHKGPGISNGKLRATEKGDIISSIEGNYPLRVVASKNEGKEHKAGEVKLVFVCSAEMPKGNATYIGMMFHDNDMRTLNEVYTDAKSNNNKMVSHLIDCGMDSQAANDIRMFRVGTNGYYGAFTINTAKYIIDRVGNGSVKSAYDGNITLSVLRVTNGNLMEYAIQSKIDNIGNIRVVKPAPENSELEETMKKLNDGFKKFMTNFKVVK